MQLAGYYFLHHRLFFLKQLLILNTTTTLHTTDLFDVQIVSSPVKSLQWQSGMNHVLAASNNEVTVTPYYLLFKHYSISNYFLHKQDLKTAIISTKQIQYREKKN